MRMPAALAASAFVSTVTTTFPSAGSVWNGGAPKPWSSR
jgi:hypothetical protein